MVAEVGQDLLLFFLSFYSLFPELLPAAWLDRGVRHVRWPGGDADADERDVRALQRADESGRGVRAPIKAALT